MDPGPGGVKHAISITFIGLALFVYAAVQRVCYVAMP